MKTKLFKRLGATVLALGMALSVMAIPTSALSTSSTGSITINNVPENTVTATVYKIMDVTVDNTSGQPQEPVYTWVDAVANWLSNNTNTTYQSYVDTTNDNAVTKTFTDLTSDTTGTGAVADFYSNLAAAALETPPAGVSLHVQAIVQETADPDGNGAIAWTENTVGETTTYSVTIDNVPMGNYLILFTGSEKSYVYSPITANVVPVYANNAWSVGSATVTPKYTTPTIDKDVTSDSENGYQIGDTVNYRVKALLPTYPEGSKNKVFDIYDKMDDGLSLNNGSIAVYYSADDSLDTQIDTLLTATTNYTLTTENVTLPNTEAATFKVEVNYDSLNAQTGYIFVTYSATVNANATVGANENDVILEYNDPYTDTDYTTDDPDTNIYTYGINVTKVDSVNASLKLNGAEFVLKDADGNELYFVSEGRGVYRLATSSVVEGDTVYEQGADTKLVTGGFDTDGVTALGQLILKGLKEGTYTLTETKAPKGYVMPGDPDKTITIVDDDNDGNINGSTGAYVISSVTNISEENGVPSLPTTGGMGTILFTTVGLVLVGGAAILLVVMYKRKKEN